jgi:hypothetical protein
MSSQIRTLILSVLLSVVLAVCLGTIWSFLKWYRLQETPQLYPSKILASVEEWKINRSDGNKSAYQAPSESSPVERAKLESVLKRMEETGRHFQSLAANRSVLEVRQNLQLGEGVPERPSEAANLPRNKAQVWFRCAKNP